MSNSNRLSQKNFHYVLEISLKYIYIYVYIGIDFFYLKRLAIIER